MANNVTPHYELYINSPLATEGPESSAVAIGYWQYDKNFEQIDAALWALAQGGGAVASVNGQTGIVVLTAGSVGADAAGSAAGALAAAEAFTTSQGYLVSPLTTDGDLLYFDGSAERLPVGVDGYVLTVEDGLPVWAPATGGFENPMTESGDMIFEDPSLGPARLAIGTSGEVLTVVNGLPAWEAAAQITTFEASSSPLSSDSTINFEGDGTYIAVSNPSAGNVKSALSIGAVQSALASAFDALGAAATAQSNAETFATSAVATETSRAEAAETLLAPIANPTFTGTVGGITYSMVGADASGAAATAQTNAEAFTTSALASYAPLASPSFSGTVTIPTLASTTIAGAPTFSGALNFTGNSTTTLGTATTNGSEVFQNISPTVTGATTTLALTQATLSSGNTIYTHASESGAASNAWVNASVTIAGFTNAGNNGTFVITASTATTFTVVNASGVNETHAATCISSAVVGSPIITLAGTINSGTAGTLNSVADSWSLQAIPASVAPNPVSSLGITHTGSSGAGQIVYNPGVNGPSFNLVVGTNTILSCVSNNTTTLSSQTSVGTSQLILKGSTASSTTSAANVIIESGVVVSATTGTVGVLQVTGTFDPTSGSGAFFGVEITPTIEGTSSGNTTALLVNPTITTTALTGSNLVANFSGTLNGTGQQGLSIGYATAAPTSAGTAGVLGEIVQYGGVLYFCSVAGAAGSATWNKLTMSSV